MRDLQRSSVKTRSCGVKREFSAEDLQDAFLGDCRDFCSKRERSVYRAADARGLLCNAVDDIENCHFYYGAVVAARRSCKLPSRQTERVRPGATVAQRARSAVRREYENWLDGSAPHGMLYAQNRARRQASNKEVLHNLASKEGLERFLHEAPPRPQRKRVDMGKAVPVEPDGRSRIAHSEAARVLEQATSSCFDSLVSAEVLQLVSPTAEIVDVGKRAPA